MSIYNQGQVRQQQELADETKEVIKRSIHAYWDQHPFYRMSVKVLIKKFCGWEPIIELVNFKANSELERAFLSALFLTGGRIVEVLNLKKENFSIFLSEEDGEEQLQVSEMLLEKRYKKIGDKYKGEDGKNHFDTEKDYGAVRNDFSFPMKEPLAPILWDWVQNSQSGFLFPSPYHHRGERKGERCLSRHWAYKFIRSLDSTLPDDLKERLGLNKPFIVERTEENPQGRIKAKNLHLWLHWFRSERVSELYRDYNFSVEHLMDFFGWTKYETAKIYLHLSTEQYAKKMHVATYK